MKWIKTTVRTPDIKDGEVLAWILGAGPFIEYIKPEPDDQTGWTQEQFAKIFSHWCLIIPPEDEGE